MQPASQHTSCIQVRPYQADRMMEASGDARGRWGGDCNDWAGLGRRPQSPRRQTLVDDQIRVGLTRKFLFGLIESSAGAAAACDVRRRAE